MGQSFLADALARIFHLDENLLFTRIKPSKKPHLPRAVYGIHGIEHQVDQALLDLVDICQNVRDGLFNIHMQLDIPKLEFVASQFYAPLDQVF